MGSFHAMGNSHSSHRRADRDAATAVRVSNCQFALSNTRHVMSCHVTHRGLLKPQKQIDLVAALYRVCSVEFMCSTATEWIKPFVASNCKEKLIWNHRNGCGMAIKHQIHICVNWQTLFIEIRVFIVDGEVLLTDFNSVYCLKSLITWTEKRK